MTIRPPYPSARSVSAARRPASDAPTTAIVECVSYTMSPGD